MPKAKKSMRTRLATASSGPLSAGRRVTRSAGTSAGRGNSSIAQLRCPQQDPPLRRSTRVSSRSRGLSEEAPAPSSTSAAAAAADDDDQDSQESDEQRELSSTSQQPVAHTPPPRLISNATDQSQSQFVFSWVNSNYQYEPNHNVPRSGMYEHYIAACSNTHNNVQPVNSATFGKLIRHVFPDISTRRLGTRGQSRYHYCGIRRRTSPVPQNNQPVPTETPHTPSLPRPSRGRALITGHQHNHHRVRRSTAIPSTTRYMPISVVASYSSDDALERYQQHGSLYHSAAGGSSRPARMVPPQTQWQYNNHYGSHAPSEPIVDVHLPAFAAGLPDTLKGNDLAHNFARAYEKHCHDILECIKTCQFNNVFSSMVTFYHTLPDTFRTLIESEPQLTEVIWRWDCCLYDAIILSMLPTVYAPIDHATLLGLRQLTREIDQYISESLRDSYPPELCQIKIRVAQVFVSKFRRNLKLNQMAQIVSALLFQKSSFDIMIEDWNNIDFPSILDQAFWVCECDSEEIRRLLQEEIPNLLQARAGLPQWVSWIHSKVDKYIRNIQRQQISREDHGYCLFHIRQILCKWNYFGSLVIKDLSFNHAASVEAFRVLQDFFDDLLLFLMEGRIAITGWTKQSPVAPTTTNEDEIPATGNNRGVPFETPPPSVGASTGNNTDQSTNAAQPATANRSPEN